MKVLAFGVLFLLSLSQAVAQEITLNCFTDDGQEASDLTIDLDAGTMSWGTLSTYTIRHSNDTYISAYEDLPNDRVGGEIWVINRITGEYKRGRVGNYCAGQACDDVKLNAFVYEGRCSKPQF